MRWTEVHDFSPFQDDHPQDTGSPRLRSQTVAAYQNFLDLLGCVLSPDTTRAYQGVLHSKASTLVEVVASAEETHGSPSVEAATCFEANPAVPDEEEFRQEYTARRRIHVLLMD
jgi:hypothetical protein